MPGAGKPRHLTFSSPLYPDSFSPPSLLFYSQLFHHSLPCSCGVKEKVISHSMMESNGFVFFD